ncbi:hypothetical protein AGDE_12743 [Angomonas deanei]|uniref:Cytochrome b5-like Heme/Steroid binding domain containing protein, putative n=1 Tax=Angomonas deanei TaxID=59799 RepID=A0A7G2C5A0_9TRYP|nr:hypothetical protein AGDE_12743 [Angomonas deanei]CAD2214900.1 Cytochrome b5-like Heme/Steroid binding domain containing protein, putative [Angomonas deanei]|eukprot:EPY23596.1 hypothetical protein AGDE_12743 [Angomonas deanei]
MSKVAVSVSALAALLSLAYYLLEVKGYKKNVRRALTSGDEGGKRGHTHKKGTIRPVARQQQKGYTKEDLAQYDGVQNPQILISLKRKVYEVDPHFYGPGQHYHCFAGREASRPLAKSQLNDAEANKYWVDCTDEELETLDEYVELFDSKYPVVGWFIPSEDFFNVGK